MSCLLNCKNTTIAISVMNELKNKNVLAWIVPKPSQISDGCGLSLIINDVDFNIIDTNSDKYVVYLVESLNNKKNYKRISSN